LNALLVVCVRNNYTGTIDIIKFLSKSLRRLLSWKDDLVAVEEELSFTEMYLKIEKFRFCDKFEYSISVDDGLLHYKIPKLSLQPLVENACMHGIQAIKGIGKIHVAVFLEDGCLKARVEDNGSGINSLKLEEILRNMTDREESNSSIGIRNVYRRLKLYYGDEVSFNIESGINSGTSVCFSIPVERLQTA
jgi:two-component system sensor histidine kinase YesM